MSQDCRCNSGLDFKDGDMNEERRKRNTLHTHAIFTSIYFTISKHPLPYKQLYARGEQSVKLMQKFKLTITFKFSLY